MVKAYPIDPGLARANAPASTIDEGQALEDAVCIVLLRGLSVSRAAAVSSLKTKEHGYEVDFVAGDALFDSGVELLQVTASLADEKTRRRELRALWEAMAEFDLPVSTIVVGDGPEEIIEQDGRTIRCIPAWKWFLQAR